MGALTKVRQARRQECRRSVGGANQTGAPTKVRLRRWAYEGAPIN